MSTADCHDLYGAKADFSAVYNQADPRAYYRVFGALGYEIPAHGAAVFELLLNELGGRAGKTVLDLCCSYGVTAALLNYDVDLEQLFEHYAEFEPDIGSTAVRLADAAWFGERRRADAVSIVGLDVADRAVRYGTAVGLLDCGLIGDLENEQLDCSQTEALRNVDLITVTGGVGYIGKQTFRSVIEATDDDPPWIATFNLRWIDFEPIADTLNELGLITEQVNGYAVPQRQFADAKERAAAFVGLHARNLDPAPELELGGHCAELYVTRPPEAVRDKPIDVALAELMLYEIPSQSTA